MGLSFHCPQCSQPVPALVTQMGQQVTCPACKSQFRLSPMLLEGNGQSGAAASPPRPTTATPSPPAASPPAAAPVATAAAPPVATVVRPPIAPRAAAVPTAAVVRPPVAAPAPSPPVAPAAKVPAAAVPAPSAAAAPPPQPKPNVARFIAAASQDSTVQLTAEGKLPELSLTQAMAKKPATSESHTSPLVLGLVLVGSTLLSILLLVVNFEDGGTSSESVAEAREKIGQFYASAAGSEKPYQALLREANLAYSRRDVQAERELYGRVRDLLLSEQADRFTGAGVTGTKSGDDELKRLLGILLSKEGR